MALWRLKRSVTLIELLIAVVLFTLVFLTFSSIDLFSRRQLLSLERQTKLQNEVSTLVAHISKNLQKAEGDRLAYPVIVNKGIGSSKLSLRILVDSDGQRLNYKTVRYYWVRADASVTYWDDLYGNPDSYEIIARNISAFAVDWSVVWNYVQLNIIACWEPAQKPAYYTNPCVTMVTRVTMPAVSTN